MPEPTRWDSIADKEHPDDVLSPSDLAAYNEIMEKSINRMQETFREAERLSQIQTSINHTHYLLMMQIRKLERNMLLGFLGVILAGLLIWLSIHRADRAQDRAPIEAKE